MNTSSANGTPAADVEAVTAVTSEGAPAARPGLGGLPCPQCGEEATIRLDLDDCKRLTCSSCDGEFETSDVREFIAKWTKVLDWIDSRPA